MNPENEFNDRLIRLPELERIFGVCKRTVRRKAENGELPPLRRIGRAVGTVSYTHLPINVSNHIYFSFR